MYEETNIKLMEGLKYRRYLLFKKDFYKVHTILFLIFSYKLKKKIIFRKVLINI